jgi:hypothetical protein
MRRFISALLLLATVAFQAEAVLGEARDGSVHHEEAAEAWVHAHDPHGSHSHDGPEGPRSLQLNERAPSSEHEHGTTTDHCTHVHGMALVCTTDLDLILIEWRFGYSGPSVPADVVFEALSPPPRP